MSSSLLKRSLLIIEEADNWKTSNKFVENKKSKGDDIATTSKAKDLKRLENENKEVSNKKESGGKKKKKASKDLDRETAQLLFDYAVGKNNRVLEKKLKKKKPEVSIFTDEDFAKFEREYFG